jgi:pyruvate formate lyase activating enzyme
MLKSFTGHVASTSKETAARELNALIFDIQAHSVHDGPGTRTTVFLSGCPLHCIWCCNPEGLARVPVIMWKQSKCVCCGECIKACPHKAISIADDGKTLLHDRKFCDVCKTHECVEVCLHEALSLTAKYYTIDNLMEIFKRDRQFWGSHGGVTFSGGEPLFQQEFMLAILKKCREQYIHTAIETTTCVPTSYFMEAMKYVEWVFSDLKHMNPDRHRELTGVDNRLILKNTRLLAEDSDWNGFYIIRIPIIPGINDSRENITETAEFVRSCGLEAINILPFHRLGESKYRQMDQEYRFKNMKPPGEEHMNQIKKWIEKTGLVCFIGYKTPF